MRRFFLLLPLLLLAVACGGGDRQSEEGYDALLSGDIDEETLNRQMDAVRGELVDADYLLRHYAMSHSQEDLSKLIELQGALQQLHDIMAQMDNERGRKYRDVQLHADSLQMAVQRTLDTAIVTVRKSLVALDDYLLDSMVTYPLYLKRGSTLFLDFQTGGNATVKVYNTDSRALLKTYAGKKSVSDKIAIANSAIYLVEITPKGAQYVTLAIDKTCASVEDFNADYDIRENTTEGSKSDFRAKAIKGLSMRNMFDEPRKITLRSQGKALFSGSSRSVVTIQVPAGTTDLLYSLRISTNEGDCASDGQFCDNMRSTYKQVKFLGLPVYESQGGESSLIRELLNDNMPPREEEAYCSMYVITRSDQAKKFQDNVHASDLKYDIDRSCIGTQSCNGRLNVKGIRTLYLCFENERFRYSNYLWLEVIAAVPTTEYMVTRYSLADDL